MKFSELKQSLLANGVFEYENEALIILDYACSKNPAYVFAHPETDYDDSVLLPILQKRKERIPIQYIFGHWEFMGLDFTVTPDTLIPRYDTEAVVEIALRHLKKGDTVADFCTGSGCIGISLAHWFPSVQKVDCFELSEKAIAVANENVEKNRCRNKVKVFAYDVLGKFPSQSYDMIVSNPPYIPRKDLENLSQEVKKEPKMALDGGEDGLVFYRRLLDYLPYLNDGGVMIWEIGFDQKAPLQRLMQERQIANAEFFQDYQGNDRIVVIKK